MRVGPKIESQSWLGHSISIYLQNKHKTTKNPINFYQNQVKFKKNKQKHKRTSSKNSLNATVKDRRQLP